MYTDKKIFCDHRLCLHRRDVKDKSLILEAPKRNILTSQKLLSNRTDLICFSRWCGILRQEETGGTIFENESSDSHSDSE